MFFRIETDGTRTPMDVRGLFAGPSRSLCWIIGGGPSLASLPCQEIAATPVPRFGVNLSGAGLIRPTIWTSYDPTARFQRSIYLDGTILKLVSARRAMDLVPDSTFKVCESPNLLFFDRTARRGFHDFPPLGNCDDQVVDWQDSLIQAIELAWRLGFRELVLIGCDMFVRPEPTHLRLAREHGIDYTPGELLKGFHDRCEERGLSRETLEQAAASRPYHFEETKPLAAAMQTDFHYFRVAQYLRLSRRALSLSGLELISATPCSRLNDFFPYRPVEEVIDDIQLRVGDPRSESTRGKYSESVPSAAHIPMRDFKPHGWHDERPGDPKHNGASRPAVAAGADRRQRLREAIEELPEVEVRLEEVG